MCSKVAAGVNAAYEILVPSFTRDVISVVASEIDGYMENVYQGARYMRCDVENVDDFLKQKAFYISKNPWQLGRQMLCFSLITAVGLLIAPTMGVYLGYGIAGAAAFFAAAHLRQYSKGDHLENAMALIVNRTAVPPEQDPFADLPSVNYKVEFLGKLAINPADVDKSVMKGVIEVGGKKKTVFVVFKDLAKNETTMRVYYFGARYIKQRIDISQPTPETKCKMIVANHLRGSDIKRLWDLAQPDIEG